MINISRRISYFASAALALAVCAAAPIAFADSSSQKAMEASGVFDGLSRRSGARRSLVISSGFIRPAAISPVAPAANAPNFRKSAPETIENLFPPYDAIEARVLAKLIEYLRGMESSKEEAEMLKTIPLVAADLPSVSMVAAYYMGMMAVNRKAIEFTYISIRAKGALRGLPKDRVPELVAQQLVPIVVHELRHAVNVAKLGASAESVEEEVSGFVATMRAYAEAAEKFPEAFKYGTIPVKLYEALSERWLKQGGYEGMRSYVVQAYGSNAIVLAKEETFRKRIVELGAAANEARSELAALDQELARCAASLWPAACRRVNGISDINQWARKKSKGLLASRAQFERVIKETQNQAEFLGDRRRVSWALGYYYHQLLDVQAITNKLSKLRDPKP